MSERAVRLSPSEFAEAFPFHFAFASDLRIRQTGRSLPLVCPGLQEEARVDEHLRLKYPAIDFEFSEICSHATGLFILETAQGMKLRGQMLPQPEQDQVVFLGSPWLTEAGEVRKANLTIRDFALHDPFIDLLQLMQTGLSALADSRRLAAELTRRQIELERLSLVASKTHNGVLITDARGVIEWVNEGFERLTGYSADEVVGRKPGGFLQGPGTDPATVDRIRQKLGQGESFSEEILNYHKDGRPVWITLDITPIRDSEGRVVRFIGLESDITPRRQAQEALRLARQQEAEIGFKIQEALLLGRLPADIHGLQVDAFSVPSQTIGGDFYDFFRHGPRCVDVVLGDVMGKGIAAALLAAAIKSQFLQAVTELVLESKGLPPEPERIVSRVHEALTPHLISLESFATLVYARFDLDRGSLTYVDCGHERTLLLRGTESRCEILAGENVPLGFAPAEIYRQSTIPIADGDVLLLYSDGLTETRSLGGAFFGRGSLEEVLVRGRQKSPRELLSLALREVTTFARTSTFGDDLTCIAVRVGEAVPDSTEAARVRTLQVSSSLEHLATIRAFVEDLCRNVAPAPVADQTLDLVQLAVGEVATNIMRHAYGGREDGDVELEGEVDVDRIVFRLYDRGTPFTPPLTSEPDLLERHEGGLGLFLIMESMDAVRYGREADGRNCVTLEKYVPARAGRE